MSSPGPLVILGMQRSGTSALAGALARGGLSLGDESQFLPPDANNREGYFESRRLLQWCHQALAQYHLGSTDLARLPENWEDHPLAGSLVDRLKAVLLEEKGNSEHWGFKQPLLSLLTPILLRAFAELDWSPKFVVMVRDPREIQKSEAAWEFGVGSRQLAPVGDRAVALWLSYTVQALSGCQEFPFAVVRYEDLLSDPGSLGRVFELLPNFHGSLEAAARHIRPDLRRQVVLAGPLSQVEEARELEAWTRAPDRSKLSSVLSGCEAWFRIMAPAPPEGTQIGLAWHGSRGPETARAFFDPAGGRQQIEIEFSAPPGALVNIVFYHRPCVVWIKEARIEAGGNSEVPRFFPGPGSHLSEVENALCLRGAYEPRQLNFRTPQLAGPYRLKFELTLESNESIENGICAQLADRIHQCIARKATR